MAFCDGASGGKGILVEEWDVARHGTTVLAA